MTTKKTNTTRSEKIFFIAAPVMFAVYALLCIYVDNMPKGIYYAALSLMCVLMLATVPGIFSFIKDKDIFYSENIRPGIRHSITGILIFLISAITLYGISSDNSLLVFVIQPLIVLASQYVENIVFVIDSKKTSSTFGRKFLNQNRKSEYSIPGLSKINRLMAILLSLFVAVLPLMLLLLWKYDSTYPHLNVYHCFCICMAFVLWLVLCEKAGFSVLAYKNGKIRRIRAILSLLAGVILFVYFSFILFREIFYKEYLFIDFSYILSHYVFYKWYWFELENVLSIQTIVLLLYIPVLWLYAESWITLYFLVSKKRETSSNVNVSVNNQTSKKSFKTKGFAKIAIIVLLVLLGIVSYKVYDKNHKLLLLSKEADSLYDSGKYEESLKKYLEAYSKGFRVDEVRIGYMYRHGQGVKQDDAEAVKWYRKAADQDNAAAQNALGYIYYNGQGVDKDYTEAVKWFRKSADQGNTDGQFNLGYMYENGYGVSKSSSEAIKLYEQSAAQGDETAKSNLKRLTEKIATELSKEADSLYDSGRYSEALSKYLEAYDKGYREDENRIGYMYQYGQGVEKNYTEAVKWFRQAAEQGDALGQNNLGVMYENGTGVDKSYPDAVKWYRKAAEQGNADGQYNLGTMYENGYGVDKDEDEAIRLYEQSAAQGNEDAKNNLKRLKEKKAKVAKLKKGDKILFGSYPFYSDGSSKAINWIILEKDSSGLATVISDYVLDNVMFSSTGSAEPWERSTVMNWLNSDFINKAFNSSEKDIIEEFTVPRGGKEKETNFKVQLLSVDEAKKYFNSDSERIAYPTPYAKSNNSINGNLSVDKGGSCWWWLGTPGHQSDLAADVHSDGFVHEHGGSVGFTGVGVRPVLVMRLDSSLINLPD